MKLIDYSIIKCPFCGGKSIEKLELVTVEDRCTCKHCGMELKPLPGDCCVYCSYGSAGCIKMQIWKAIEAQLDSYQRGVFRNWHS